MNEIQYKMFVLDLVEEFPGLVNGEQDVNGGDLVDWLTRNIEHMPKDALEEINEAAEHSPNKE